MEALITVIYFGPAVGRTHSIFRAFGSDDRVLRELHQGSEARCAALARREPDPWPDGIPMSMAREILGHGARLVKARDCRWQFAAV